jgi:5-methylcytosine-specific restriction endonuclease McrA
MFNCEQEPLSLLLELTPKLAKKRYRQSIYDAWDHKCGYCEDQATSLDHIVPRFRSGSSNRNNLLPCCKRCNANKASSKMEEWYPQQTYYTEVRMNRIEAWIHQEIIDLFTYNIETVPDTFAAG